MTFSDAEDDQPNKKTNGNLIPNGNSSPMSSSGASTSENETLDCVSDAAASLNTSKKEASSNDTANNSSQTDPSASSISSNNIKEIVSNENNSSPVESRENGLEDNQIVHPNTSDQIDNNGQASSANSPSSVQNVHGESTDLQNEEQDCEIGKVAEKLHQIENYIEQTAAAMSALEEEGNLIERTSGTESIGLVRPLREEGVHIPLQDRLARHETEAQELSGRLRDSLVRRQELMSRYQATRERLNNLKRQRLGIVGEERRLLQSMGAPEDPYENPIPGAESWSILQLENAIVDFQGLRDKVSNLHGAYIAKMRGTDENDSSAREDVQRKINQITNKKTQISNALAKLAELLRVKRERTREGAETSRSNPNTEARTTVESDFLAEPQENGIPSSSIRMPTENTEEVEEEEVVDEEGAIGVVSENPNISAKQRHLKSLKNQLENMKELLRVTHESTNNTENDEATESLASVNINPDNNVLEGVDLGVEFCDDPLVDGTITGLNGEVIHLTERERRNPLLASKYNQLTEAKKRLEKMEEIMDKIAEARRSGKAVADVLSPENMAILDAAKEEERLLSESNNSESLGRNNESILISSAHRTDDRGAEGLSRATSLNFVQKNNERASSSREWGTEPDLSAMQFQLDKKSTRIPPVNEGHIEVEKGAVKKQARELLSDRGNDPRFLEMLALQDELKEKKTALEGLMQRMGKSSSYAFDNISDRNSDTGEKPSAIFSSPHQMMNNYPSHAAQNSQNTVNGYPNQPFQSYQSNPSNQPPQNICNNYPNPPNRSSQNYSNGHTNQPSQNHQNLMNGYLSQPTQNSYGQEYDFTGQNSNEESVRRRYDNFANGNELNNSSFKSCQPQTGTPGQAFRQPFNNSRTTGRQDLSNLEASYQTNRFSLNNLNSTPMNSVRPKINRFPERSLPVTSWENVPIPNTPVPPPAGTKVQNSVSFALSQLNQLQETISTLYGDLRAAEENVRHQEPPSANVYGNNAFMQPPSYNPQSFLANFNATVLPNAQGRNDPNASNQLSSALQQCFSQLHLHSVEIQSLNKQLQNIECRNNLESERHMRENFRSTPFDLRNNRLCRDIGRQNIIRNLHNSSNELHPNSGLETQNLSGFEDGFSNPIYDRIPNVLPSTEACEDDTSFRNNQPQLPLYEASGASAMQLNDEDFIIDWDTELLLEPGMIEEISLVKDAPIHSQEGQQHNTSILNNQVLPGTRTNNYWDNFRSYSRQNPLSTSNKSNTFDRFSLSDSNATAMSRVSIDNRRQQLPRGPGKKNGDFKVTYSNNSINKASDKNSSSARTLNKARARIKSCPQNKSSKPETSAFYLLPQNNVQPLTPPRVVNKSYKRNNRSDLVSIPRESDAPFVFSKYDHNSCSSIQTFDGRIKNSDTSHFSGDIINRFEAEISRNSSHDTRDARENNYSLRNWAERIQPNTQQSDAELNTAHSYDAIKGAECLDDVMKEAEHLMEKHSSQPDFLLQLFQHASNITSNTDQQVALELLSELSTQNQNVNNRSPLSVNGLNNNNDVLFSPIHKPNQQQRSTSHFSNQNLGRVLCPVSSASSESDLSISDDEEKNLNSYYKVKSLKPPKAFAMGLRKSIYKTPPSSPRSRSAPQSRPVLQHSATADSRLSQMGFFRSVQNASSEEGGKNDKQYRKRRNPERNFRNSLHSNSIMSEPNIDQPHNPHCTALYDEKLNDRRLPKKSTRRELESGDSNTSRSTNNDHRNFSYSSDSSVNSKAFVAIVSSAISEVFSVENCHISKASSSLVLDGLHHSIMKQVNFHSSKFEFSSDFISSVDSHLKEVLLGFRYKRFSSVRQDIAAAVTDVMMREYCCYSEQQIINNNSSGLRKSSPESLNNCKRSANSNENALNRKSNHSAIDKQPDDSFSLFGQLHSSSSPRMNFKANSNSDTSWSFIQPPSSSYFNKETKNRHSSLTGAISKNTAVVHKTAMPCFKENSSVRPKHGCLATKQTKSDDGFSGLSSPESCHSLVRESNLEDAVEACNNGTTSHPNTDNFTEADQIGPMVALDHITTSLPVYELAEADQSQDTLDSSWLAEFASRLGALTPSSSSSGSLSCEESERSVAMSPKTKDDQDTPNEILDAVPTRLSASHGPASELSDPHSVNGTGEPVSVPSKSVAPVSFPVFEEDASDRGAAE